MAKPQSTTMNKAIRAVERQRDPLARAFQLLTLMVDSNLPTFGVRQLAGLMSVSASTAHRLLGDLEQIGLIDRTDDSTYRIGLEFYRLASSATARFPLREAAAEVLHSLAIESTESAFLGVYDKARRQMTFALCVESAHPLRYVVPLNRWLPIHAGASGLAILAFLPEPEQRELLGTGRLSRETDNTIVEPRKLERVLAEVRAAGYATSNGQRITGASAIAAPVIGANGFAVGDVGISMPALRVDAAGHERRQIDRVQAAAATVSARIGGPRRSAGT